jgi:hypothetical protein
MLVVALSRDGDVIELPSILTLLSKVCSGADLAMGGTLTSKVEWGECSCCVDEKI